jgi:hypothetical protein
MVPAPSFMENAMYDLSTMETPKASRRNRVLLSVAAVIGVIILAFLLFGCDGKDQAQPAGANTVVVIGNEQAPSPHGDEDVPIRADEQPR